ncbi:MAG: prepilin-type N-terminal cleavage/methylation domain-containing protein, partial [Longimicrobiales bacterium]|nr:prepilin-type N-terminal cleavage/methylation domain-containing protein [Longimicrobiales bacterium]
MRKGFTFVEVLLALTLSLVVAGGAWSLIVVHSRGSVEAAATSDRLDATRVVRAVVEGELRGGLPGRDWTVFGPDSLALRAFRGVAVACGPAV